MALPQTDLFPVIMMAMEKPTLLFSESKLILSTAGSRKGIWTTNYGTTLIADDFNDTNVMIHQSTNRSRDNLVWAKDALFGTSTSVSVVEQSGQLEITSPSGSGEHFNGYNAIYPLNFTGAKTSVEAKQVVDNTGGETWMFVYPDSDNYYRIGVRKDDDGVLRFKVFRKTGGTESQLLSFDYNSFSQHSWRIRHQGAENGGEFVFETKANDSSATWFSQLSVANTFETRKMFVSLTAGKRSATATATSTAIFDNLEVTK